MKRVAEYIIPIIQDGKDCMPDFLQAKKLIRCANCRYYTGKWCKRDTIQVIADLKDKILMKYSSVSENDYCSRAERRGEEDVEH